MTGDARLVREEVRRQRQRGRKVARKKEVLSSSSTQLALLGAGVSIAEMTIADSSSGLVLTAIVEIALLIAVERVVQLSIFVRATLPAPRSELESTEASGR